MAVDATSRFFERLDRGALLEKVEGIVRFDLQEEAHTEHWLVKINRGEVSVSREERDADAVVGSAPALFEAIVRGEENSGGRVGTVPDG